MTSYYLIQFEKLNLKILNNLLFILHFTNLIFFFKFLFPTVAIDLIVQAISDYLKIKEDPNYSGDFGFLQVKNLHESLVIAQECDGINSRSMTPINITNH